MRLVCASLVLAATFFLQTHAAGPRIAPVPGNQRSSEQQSIAAKFASAGMPNAVATYLNHPALADHILPYEHYVWNDSTLPSRHRAILGIHEVDDLERRREIDVRGAWVAAFGDARVGGSRLTSHEIAACGLL